MKAHRVVLLVLGAWFYGAMAAWFAAEGLNVAPWFLAACSLTLVAMVFVDGRKR